MSANSSCILASVGGGDVTAHTRCCGATWPADPGVTTGFEIWVIPAEGVTGVRVGLYGVYDDALLPAFGVGGASDAL